MKLDTYSFKMSVHTCSLYERFKGSACSKLRKVQKLQPIAILLIYKKWLKKRQKFKFVCNKCSKFWNSIYTTQIHFMSKFGVIWSIFGKKMAIFCLFLGNFYKLAISRLAVIFAFLRNFEHTELLNRSYYEHVRTLILKLYVSSFI